MLFTTQWRISKVRDRGSLESRKNFVVTRKSWEPNGRRSCEQSMESKIGRVRVHEGFCGMNSSIGRSRACPAREREKRESCARGTEFVCCEQYRCDGIFCNSAECENCEVGMASLASLLLYPAMLACIPATAKHDLLAKVRQAEGKVELSRRMRCSGGDDDDTRDDAAAGPLHTTSLSFRSMHTSSSTTSI